MRTLEAKALSPQQLQEYLQYAIAPRPICFASTVDAQGQINLSPFSFFNMFGTNPPMCVFSPARRVRDNTLKHTLENVLEVPECVINIVDYPMIQQMSLASTEYEKGVNEFLKSGFTMLKSDLVKPPRVAEAPVQLECEVVQVLPLGDQHGAGNLILAEVKLIHLQERILNEEGKIDQEKLDLVARLGGDWYTRANKSTIFKVPKPLRTLGIGVDMLPYHARNSKVLSGNDLGLLGNQEHIPSEAELLQMQNLEEVKMIFDATIGDSHLREQEVHELAKQWIAQARIYEALTLLMLLSA